MQKSFYNMGVYWMNISTAEVKGVMVARVRGRAIDSSNAKDFKSAISPLISPEAKLVFDLAQVDFVDSTGLGALISCLRQAQNSQADIKLCSLSKPVRALFELVRMHKVFNIFNSPEEAVHSYD